jgi:adenosylcobinamide kinase/adenosylcobinamide-phosphate guanylyltransferase
MRPAHELILGGARSGKSRLAESRAADWLASAPGRSAVLVATAMAGDDEMAARIQRHQQDRAARVPMLATVEAPLALVDALRAQAAPDRLLLVDCLTLWITQCLMPPASTRLRHDAWQRQEQALLDALDALPSPVVLVSNEIGLGVLPMSREARACVDALGRLHQQVAARCARVTLMVAGCPLVVKDTR